jgi:hypothetical protein
VAEEELPAVNVLYGDGVTGMRVSEEEEDRTRVVVVCGAAEDRAAVRVETVALLAMDEDKPELIKTPTMRPSLVADVIASNPDFR